MKKVTRRAFLVGGTGALGCAAAPWLAGKRGLRSGQGRPVRVAVLGLGHRGQRLALAVRRLAQAGQGVRLAGGCDIYAPRRNWAAHALSIPVYASWQAMLANIHCDAVMVAAPDHWHARMAIAAMELGKDVYCEAPMARTLDEAAQMQAAVKRTGWVLQIGAVEASNPGWRILGDWIREGRLGNVRWCQTDPSVAKVELASREPWDAELLDWPGFHGSEPAQVAVSRHRYFNWRSYWEYTNGRASTAHFNALAPLLRALGTPVPAGASAVGGTLDGSAVRPPDALTVRLEYPEGYTIVLPSPGAKTPSSGPVIRGTRASCNLWGAEACFRRLRAEVCDSWSAEACFRNKSPSSEAHARHEFSSTEACFRAQPHASAPLLQHIEDWLESIRSRSACICNEDVGYATMAAIDAAMKAYRNAVEDASHVQAGLAQA